MTRSRSASAALVSATLLCVAGCSDGAGTSPTVPTTSVAGEGGLEGVVLDRFWGPLDGDAGWLLVDVTGGASVDGSPRVALYVPFAEVEFCDVAAADGYSEVLQIPVIRDQLVSTLPISFHVDPLVGGPSVPYPDDQAVWQGVPRRNAREVHACPPSGADAADVLADQRAKWESTGIQTYEFVVFWGVFNAAYGYHRVTVIDGRPATVEPFDPGFLEGLSEFEQQAALDTVPATIDEVFAVLGRAGDADWVQADYDPELGYPLRARVDADFAGADDEFEIRITEFHAVGQVPPSAG